MASFSRLPLLSPTAAASRHATTHRCFRTDASGRIALAADWPKLFSSARRFPALALQTRHAYVRLIHLGALPAFAWTEAGATAAMPDVRLEFHPATWAHASGRLAECPCCGTPGRIEISNSQGLDAIQLCALAACPPSDWAAYLEEFALDANREPASPDHTTAMNAGDFFPPPAEAMPMVMTTSAETIPDFLAALADHQVPFTAQLRTPESTHTREFLPHRLAVHERIFTTQSSSTTLQIGLPALRGLAVSVDASGTRQLHLLGPQDALLLTLAPAAAPRAARDWAHALHASFALPV